MFGLGLPEFLIILVAGVVSAAVVGIPAALISRRLGYSPWLGVVAILPIANLALLWFVAIAPWPAFPSATIGPQQT